MANRQQPGTARIDRTIPAGLTVREATPADNDALIAIELGSPLQMGGGEETYDRSPDFFACHRQKADYRVLIAEWEGRPAGLMTGVIQEPLINGQRHRIMYVQQARVLPEFHGRRVAWSLANHLFAWGASCGAEGPYYLIAPDNAPSLAFVRRGGGRWPLDVGLISFQASEAGAGAPSPIDEGRLPEAAALINAAHAGQDFFGPLTADSLAARLSRHPLYTLRHLYGVTESGRLVSVAGLWDKGATTERIFRDNATGETSRSRGAYVCDWGYAPGCEDAFATLLRDLAAQARHLGRTELTICEPSPGAVPDPGLPLSRTPVALFTPTITPPPAEAARAPARRQRGLFIDMLYL